VGLNTIVTDQMLPTIRYMAGYSVDEVEGPENDLGLERPGWGGAGLLDSRHAWGDSCNEEQKER